MSTPAVDNAIQTLRLRLGRVLDEKLNKIDEALTCYRDVLYDDERSRPAIEALVSIYARLGQSDDLLEMYDRKFDLVETVDEKVQILARVAAIHESVRGDLPSAIERHEQILGLVEESDSSYRESLQALHRLHRQLQDWDQLVAVIEMELELETEDAKIALLAELGSISLHQLMDVEAGLSSYAKVLAAQPTHEAARRDVESLLQDDSHGIGACDILEPIYVAEEAWRPLVGLLEIRINQLSFESDTEAERKALLGRVVEIQAARLSDPASAFDAATRQLALAPEDPEVRQKLEDFAAAANGWGALADVYIDRLGDLQTGEDVQLARWYAVRIAQICDVQLDEPTRAVDYYNTALELEPEHRPSLDALAELYHRTEQWPELLTVHQRQIALSEDTDEIRTLRFRVAELYRSQLFEPSEAINTFLTVLGEDEADGEALAQLEGLYEEQGQFVELGEVLQKQIGLSEEGSEEWCLRMCRLAAVQEQQL
ncbi:MAG: tetratricopeptide repeat protein, partial [Myxococcales bacterium]|nr:tetratricopeptide repeat protein [Myxococcales bacterium]